MAAVSFKFQCEEVVKRFQMLGAYATKLYENLATPPSCTTVRCNTLKGSPQHILQKLSSELSSRSDHQFEAYIHPVIRDLIVIKNQGPVVRQKLDKEVIVDRFCGMAVLRGADVFASGLLAMSGSIKQGDSVSLYVDVSSVCLRGALPPYNFDKIHLGNGVAKYSRHEIYSTDSANLSGVGVDVTEPLYISPKLNGLLPELIFPQNLPSVLCAHVLDPQPTDAVLDMCAAPGGKTCHIASLMQNSGVLVALDKAKKKIDTIRDNLFQAGCTSAYFYGFDSTKAAEEEKVNSPRDISQLHHPPPYCPESFDKILLDAPCSALGQRPSLSNPITEKQLKSIPPVQRKLLSVAVRLLKPGGTLVYSTCTFYSEENELQIAWLLNHYPEMSLQSQGQYHISQTPLEAFQSCGLSTDQLKKLQLFHPAYLPESRTCDNDTIGFFIAKLTKT